MTLLIKAAQVLQRMRGRSLVSNSLYVILTQVVGKGTSALLSIALARTLTTQQFSAYTYFFITSTLLSSYFSLGLPFAIARVVAEGNINRSWGQDDRVGAILVIITAVAISAILLAPIYLPPLLPDEIPLPGLLVVAGGLTLGWAALAQAALYAHQAFRQAFWPVLVGTVMLMAVAALGISMRSVDVLICGALVGVLTPTVAYVHYLGRVGILRRGRLFRTGWRSLGTVLGTSLPGLGVAAIFVTVNWLIPRTLVEHQIGPQEFAKFALGMQWFSLVLFVPLAFGQVLFPRFLQRAHASSLQPREATLPAGLTFALIAACALAGTAVTPMLILIYGGAYDFSPAFVFFILMAAACAGAVNLLGSYVMAVRGTGVWFLVNLALLGVACAALFAVPPATAFEAARLLCVIYAVLAVLAYAVIRRSASESRAKLPIRR